MPEPAFNFDQGQVNPQLFYKVNKEVKKSDREIMKNFIATPSINHNQLNSNMNMNDITNKQSKQSNHN